MRGSCKCSCRHTTPLQVCGSSGSTVITPAFITHPNTPCGCSDVLSHPLVYHTRLGPSASCTLSPGVHKISPPPQDTTPGNDIVKSQNVITGVCYVVSVTVVYTTTYLCSKIAQGWCHNRVSFRSSLLLKLGDFCWRGHTGCRALLIHKT